MDKLKEVKEITDDISKLQDVIWETENQIRHLELVLSSAKQRKESNTLKLLDVMEG